MSPAAWGCGALTLSKSRWHLVHLTAFNRQLGLLSRGKGTALSGLGHVGVRGQGGVAQDFCLWALRVKSVSGVPLLWVGREA